MTNRLASLSLLCALFLLCGFLCYGTAAQYFGIGLKVGDAVIVERPDGRLPATVIGFTERGVKVRCEDSSVPGMKLNYAFDQCHVVDRDSAVWRELTAADAQPLASPQAQR